MALTYTQSRYGPLMGQPISAKINGRNLRAFGMEMTALPQILFPPIRQRLQTIDAMPGSIDHGSVYDPISFSLELQLIGRTQQDANIKLDAFKRELDIYSKQSQEWIVDGNGVQGFSLEISGYRFWYEPPGVTVDISSSAPTVVTKNLGSPLFSKYIVPGAQVEFTNDSASYYVESVISDTSFTLTESSSPAYKTNESVRIERRRYLICNLNGAGSISPVLEKASLKQSSIGNDIQHSSAIRNISVELIAVVPFWLSDEWTFKQAAVATDTFIEIEGLGTTPTNPTIFIMGPATNPQITSGNKALTLRTSPPIAFRNVGNLTDIIPTVAGDNRHSSLVIRDSTHVNNYTASLPIFGSRGGQVGDTYSVESLYGGDPDDISLLTDTSVQDFSQVLPSINRQTGSLRLLVKPDFGSDTNRDRYLFHDNAETNPIILRYKSTEKRWEFLNNYDGSDPIYINTSGSGSIDFGAGDWLEIVLTWEGTTKSIYVNGAGPTGASEASLEYIADSPGETIIVGSDKDNTKRFNGHIEEIAVFDVVLDDDTLTSSDVTKTAQDLTDENGNSYIHSLISLWTFEGVHGEISSLTDIGSSGNMTTVPSSITNDTETDIVLLGGGSTIFEADDDIILYDETGYKVEGVISDNTALTDTSVSASTAGGSAISNADLVGVFADLDDTTKQRFTIDKADTSSLRITGSMSGTAWIKTNKLGGKIFSLWHASGAAYVFGIDSTGKLEFTISSDGDPTSGVTGRTIENAITIDGKWHHVGFAYNTDGSDDDETVIFYIDGVAIDGDGGVPGGGGSMLSSIYASTQADFIIGNEDRNQTVSNNFDGGIRDVCIFDDVRTSDEMFQSATFPFLNVTAAGNNVSQWLFNEASTVTVINDENSNNTNDLALSGNNLTNFGTHSREQIAYVSKNLVADSKMTNGGIGGWDRANTDTILEKSSSIYASSNSALKITKNGGTLAPYALQTILTTLEGLNASDDNYYVLRFWHYGPPTVDSGESLAFITNNSTVGTRLITAGEAEITAEEWTFVEFCFEAVNDNSVLYLKSPSTTTGESGYFDKVEIFPNLVIGGTCENSTLWYTIGSPTFGTTGGPEHAGNKSLRLVPSVNGEGFESDAQIPVRADSWYEVSAWIRGNTSPGTENIVFEVTGLTDATGTTSISFTPPDSNNFRRYSFILRTAGTAGQTCRIRFTADASNEIYVDDVSLVYRHNLGLSATAGTTDSIYEPGIEGYGISVSGGDTIYLEDVPGNKSQGTAIMRFRPQWASDTNHSSEALVGGTLALDDDAGHYLFSWVSDGAGSPDIDDGIFFFYNSIAATGQTFGRFSTALSRDGTLGYFSHQDKTISFAEDELVEAAFWWNKDGVFDPKDGLTYYLKIIVNGTILYGRTDSISPYIPEDNLKHFWLGGKGINGESMTSALNGVIEGFSLYNVSLTDEEIISIYTNKYPFVNDNATMTYTATLEAGDQYIMDGNSQQTELFDVSTGTISTQNSQTSGTVPSLAGREDNEKGLIYIKTDVAIEELILKYRSRFL